MRTIEELLENNVCRDDMTEEEELNFVKYWYKKYKEGGFTSTFTTPFDLYDEDVPYAGKSFTVISEIMPDKLHDLEVLPMWKIEFDDGHKMEAYPEEICNIEIERRK